MLVDFAYDFHDYCLEKIDQVCAQPYYTVKRSLSLLTFVRASELLQRDIELDEQDIEPGCLSNMWKVLYVTVSGSLFIGAIIAHAFMISRFGGKGCFESTFFTVESLVAGIILTLVSCKYPEARATKSKICSLFLRCTPSESSYWGGPPPTVSGIHKYVGIHMGGCVEQP